jgi:hypothetical protein
MKASLVIITTTLTDRDTLLLRNLSESVQRSIFQHSGYVSTLHDYNDSGNEYLISLEQSTLFYLRLLVFVKRWQHLHENIAPPQDDDFEISVIWSVMCGSKEFHFKYIFPPCKILNSISGREKLFGNGEGARGFSFKK